MKEHIEVLTLTKAGKSLYSDTKYIIQYCRDSVTRAKNAMQEDKNIIRIGTSPMTLAQLLMPLWPKIQSHCPDMEFKIVPFENTTENAREILANLGKDIDVIGGICDGNKVILCLSAGHKTTKNIKMKGAFTVSFADADHVAACDYVGIVSANNTSDKLEKAGFHTVKSEFVDAPIITELPVTLECKLVKVGEDGHIIGEIVNVSADESILGENGLPDASKLKAITFDPVNNGYLVLGEKVGNALSDDDMSKIAGLDIGHSEIVNHFDPNFVKMLHNLKIHD